MSSYYQGKGSFRQPRPVEDTDPMSSLANIADVMLVFACGLMASLIIAWNVDLSQFTQVEMGDEQVIEEPETIDELNQGGGSNYVERGVVYQDAETGQYYLVEPSKDQSGSSSSSAASGASGSTSSASSAASGASDSSEGTSQ